MDFIFTRDWKEVLSEIARNNGMTEVLSALAEWCIEESKSPSAIVPSYVEGAEVLRAAAVEINDICERNIAQLLNKQNS